jgi:phenylpropionate dioxygenase-like ring-hydroxylating dioxygenase large terminal subunit
LIRNIDGEIHAFLNVCAHRHCLLTSQAQGHDERFRCQYHGWEYTKEGRTGCIPDAACFRPFDRDNARLRQFRAATCGELVFVCLTDDGPALEEFLGPFHRTCAAWFARPYGLKWTWQTDYQANWKVAVENSLESYHVPCLHAATFGKFPAEELCEHDLQENYTTFRTPEPRQWTTCVQRWFGRRLGLPQTGIYTQHHAHPHLTVASLDVFRLVQIFMPTSPATCRHRVWLYTPRGSAHNPWQRLLAVVLSALVRWVARQVVLEDAAIYADVQRGLEASVFPGVLGTREERVFAFQQWVVKQCGDGPPDSHTPLPAAQG